jgi:ribose-phosphate pyrophosphokinase
MLRSHGIGNVWSTDCITHPSNAVAMAPLLAQALRDIGAVRRVSPSPG